ncbi:MAG: hypothetical protein HYR94_17215 [Chloroflexi bacterium]|nr:hypothetical protein [Chloroflexota bacterium]
MRIPKYKNKETDRSLLLAAILFALLDHTVFAIYNGGKTHSLWGAIASVIFTTLIGLIMILGLAFAKFLIRRLDPYDFRGELPRYLRHLLRRKSKIREWLALWVIWPLMTILLLDFFVDLFTLEALFFLISTKFPDRSGKVKQFDEIKSLLDENNLHEAQSHFAKAVRFLDDEIDLNHENCIKEAICALEASVEKLTGKPASKDFAKVIKQLQGKELGQIPPTIANGIIQLYGYRGDGKAIAHAALQGSSVSGKEAELVLNLVASYISYLHDLYSHDENTIEEEIKQQQ